MRKNEGVGKERGSGEREKERIPVNSQGEGEISMWTSFSIVVTMNETTVQPVQTINPRGRVRTGCTQGRQGDREGAPARWTWTVEVSWRPSDPEAFIALVSLDEKFAMFTLWQSKWNCEL